MDTQQPPTHCTPQLAPQGPTASGGNSSEGQLQGRQARAPARGGSAELVQQCIPVAPREGPAPVRGSSREPAAQQPAQRAVSAPLQQRAATGSGRPAGRPHSRERGAARPERKVPVPDVLVPLLAMACTISCGLQDLTTKHCLCSMVPAGGGRQVVMPQLAGAALPANHLVPPQQLCRIACMQNPSTRLSTLVMPLLWPPPAAT